MHACVRWPGYLSKIQQKVHHANSSNFPKKTASQILHSKGSKVVGWHSTTHWSLIASQNSTFNWTLRGINTARAHGWVISSSKKISYSAEQSTFLWLLIWSTQSRNLEGWIPLKQHLPFRLSLRPMLHKRWDWPYEVSNTEIISTHTFCLICIPRDDDNENVPTINSTSIAHWQLIYQAHCWTSNFPCPLPAS